MFIIILIALLGSVVISLGFVVFKTIMSPKKLDAVPRLIKQGKTANAIKLAKQVISKEPKNYMAHYLLGKAYLKEDRKELDRQFKNIKSNFKIAIVVDMWLTGFDVPSLDTIYIDKPIQQHTNSDNFSC